MICLRIPPSYGVRAKNVPGLFTPHLSQYFRDEQRRRRSQFDRGTRMAALEEYDYDNTIQRSMYMPH